jgi:hypothetical protein
VPVTVTVIVRRGVMVTVTVRRGEGRRRKAA